MVLKKEAGSGMPVVTVKWNRLQKLKYLLPALLPLGDKSPLRFLGGAGSAASTSSDPLAFPTYAKNTRRHTAAEMLY
ncbi:hypothetical protein, unlikely [Trypanosoma brucei gambiense DAL972]|uniref:Uncharacterized protein n=1 Tax=Trypanosoma brucei gambiense (strain MHOM/CI/86/DAL972) TaxID=679716 RepID=C9ZZS1_TRYB9|nr:hypothetical protein, unlikely [Trypanosoma brucei gambiense DAL972]CBH16479.1 hypothetical protein, unlikely [Trypanosoma brucei gambiense DAL972]|eukprot:XP_011778743.1 hypothetical protein, unlikely [Trypanosoma brucei gambiense DAL972]